jgi:RNA polymerase sigma factor (sigma-70 family)
MSARVSHPSFGSSAHVPQQPRTRQPTRPYELPASVYREVDFKSRRIARVLRLPRGSSEEIASDFHLRLASAMRRFDPSRGSMQAFSAAVLSQQYMAIIKRRRAEARKHRMLSLSQLPPGHEPVAPVREAVLPFDWTRDELRLALKSLLPDDLILARLLGNMSVRAVARSLGIYHGTVVRRKQRLRRQIRAAILQIRENARTTRRGRAEMY